jgi:hypothetical protein
MRCAKYDQYSNRGTHTTLRCMSSPAEDDEPDEDEDEDEDEPDEDEDETDDDEPDEDEDEPDEDDEDDGGGTHTDTVSSTMSTMDGGHGSRCASDLCASSTSSRHSAF